MELNKTTKLLSNAKQEFILSVRDHQVLCAKICFDPQLPNRSCKHINLAKGFTSEDYDSFMEELNFGYDSVRGIQELFGIIWLKNGDWFERFAEGGLEFWLLKTCPDKTKSLFDILQGRGQ